MAKLPKEPIKKRHTEYQDGVGNLPNGTYSMTERNAIMETKKKIPNRTFFLFPSAGEKLRLPQTLLYFIILTTIYSVLMNQLIIISIARLKGKCEKQKIQK